MNISRVHSLRPAQASVYRGVNLPTHPFSRQRSEPCVLLRWGGEVITRTEPFPKEKVDPKADPMNPIWDDTATTCVLDVALG